MLQLHRKISNKKELSLIFAKYKSHVIHTNNTKKFVIFLKAQEEIVLCKKIELKSIQY